MDESDDHFSAAQLEAIDRRGLSAEQVSWRRIDTATANPVSFLATGLDQPAPFIFRRPKCPIVERRDSEKLIVLPDGEEIWVPQ